MILVPRDPLKFLPFAITQYPHLQDRLWLLPSRTIQGLHVGPTGILSQQDHQRYLERTAGPTRIITGHNLGSYRGRIIPKFLRLHRTKHSTNNTTTPDQVLYTCSTTIPSIIYREEPPTNNPSPRNHFNNSRHQDSFDAFLSQFVQTFCIKPKLE